MVALPAGAQTTCRPADAASARFLTHIRTIATSNEAMWSAARDTLGVPSVASSQVTLETKETTCKKAAEAYNREIQRLHGTPSQARRLYLVKVGNSYAAIDPASQSAQSEWGTVILLTGQYAYVSPWTQ